MSKENKKENNIIDFTKEREERMMERYSMDDIVPNWDLIELDEGGEYDDNAFIELTVEEAEAFIALGLLDPEDIIYHEEYMGDDDMFISFEAVLEDEDSDNEKHTMDNDGFIFVMDADRIDTDD